MSRLLPPKVACCLLILMLASALASSPAMAQEGLLPSRDDVAGSRSQPEFTPIDLQFGPLVAVPGVRVEEGYDSNIFGLADNAQGARYTTIAPSLGLRTDWGPHGIDLSGSATLSRYANYASQNTDEYAFHAGGHLDLDSWTANAAIGFDRTAERRHENGIPLTFGPPSLINSAIQSIEIKRSAGGITVTAHGGAEQLSYSDLERTDGTIQSQAFRDLHVWNLELAATASATNTAAVGAGASYTRSLSTVRAGQGSTAIKLRANGAIDLGMSRFEIEAGYLSHQFDNPLYKDFQGLVFKGQATWYPTPLVTLMASAERSLEPSGDPAAGATVVTSWRLKSNYELLRNLMLNAEYSQREQRFREVSTSTHSRVFAVTGEYSFNHSVAFDAYARHECRSASGTETVVGRRWCAVTVGIALNLRR